MENERILAYKMSQQLTEEDLQHVSAAGATSSYSGQITCSPQTGCEGTGDVHVDY